MQPVLLCSHDWTPDRPAWQLLLPPDVKGIALCPPAASPTRSSHKVYEIIAEFLQVSFTFWGAVVSLLLLLQSAFPALPPSTCLTCFLNAEVFDPPFGNNSYNAAFICMVDLPFRHKNSSEIPRHGHLSDINFKWREFHLWSLPRRAGPSNNYKASKFTNY